MVTVQNETDSIPAWPEPFETEEEAREFILAFRARYAQQGYYLTANGERISPEDVELVIIPAEE